MSYTYISIIIGVRNYIFFPLASLLGVALEDLFGIDIAMIL